jgi:DNA-directed RNA polymerase subunit RPC12/RpoP
MILNKTIKHRDRYKVIPGSQGSYGDPDYYPTHKYTIANGIDRGNGYQGYSSITYFLTEMEYAPIEAKTNLKKFLKKKGYGRYLNKITLDGFKEIKQECILAGSKPQNCEPDCSYLEKGNCVDREIKIELQLESTTQKKKTIGKVTHKLYKCTKCGHEQLQGTNHWGDIYPACPKCQWKRPMEMGSVWECQEPIPEGYSKPKPWTTVKLGDVIKSIEK